MKLFYRLTLLLVGLAFISSCSEDDFDIDPVLEIHETSLTFTKDAGAKDVSIDFNKGDELLPIVKSASGDDWITVIATKEGLKVSVLENKTLYKREATIEVVLKKGTPAGSIKVDQTPGGKAYIDVSEDQLKVSHKGKTIDIFINSNVEWTLSLDGEYDWLLIDSSQKDKNILSLTVTENTEITKRIAKIKLTGQENAESAVTVTQKGTMYYDFPLLDMGYIYEGSENERGMLYPNSFVDSYAFEKERGSVLASARSIVCEWTTLSPLFYKQVYMLFNPDGPVIRAIRAVLVECSVDPFDLLAEDPAFAEHIEEEGFEFVWENASVSTATYWNKDTKIALQVLGKNVVGLNMKKGVTFVHSKVKPNDPVNQVDEYKTYDAIPDFYSEFGATEEQIIAWEEAKGSRFLPEDSNADISLAFAPDPATEPNIVERIYTMDENVAPKTLMRVLLLLNNSEMALYPTGSQIEAEGYAPSREYLSLMSAGGFTCTGQMPYSALWDFVNTEKGLDCSINMKSFKNEGHIPRLCMQISPMK